MEHEKIVILSDLDGTFLDRESKTVERNMKAIEDFKAKGGHFSFASGRVPPMMRKTYPGFDSQINSPAILCNGGCLYDPESRTYLYEHRMDGAFCAGVLKEMKENFDIPYYVVYTGNEYQINENADIDKIDGIEWNKFCIGGKNPDSTEEMKKYLDKKYGDRFNMIRSNARFLEIVDKCVAKGNMLPVIKDYYKKKGLDVTICCIGDYENDLDMLKKADESFCPANSFDLVKKIAKHTVCSNNDGAIADLIEYMLAK